MRLGAVALAALVACGPGAKGPTGPTGPKPLAVPGPELGPEPSPPADLFGRAWLETVLPRFRERWTQSFLENARTFLEATHPLNDFKLACVVTFRVDGEGEVRELMVDATSGNAEFDAAAIEVVVESAPLPKPPEELKSDDGWVHVKWRFARDERREGLAGVAIERKEYELAKAIPELMTARRYPEASRRLKAAFARGEALNALLRAWAGNLVLDAIADAGTHLETRLAAAREALGWPEGKSWLVTHSRALPVEVQALLRGSGGEAKGEVDAAKLMATLGDKSATRVTRSAAARGLAKSDTPEVRKALLGALADREGTVRAAAAESLASLGPGAGVFYKVLPLVGDRDPDVRRAGVVLVAKSDGKRGLAELGPRCRREKDRAVVRSCATAFGLIAEEGARVELVRLTKAEDAEVARAAWIALAGKRERDPQAAALVATRVGDQDPVVRALAMAATGDEAALVAGLRDPDLAVRKAALRGLLRKARPAGIEQALDIVAGSTSVDERWWVGAVLLEAL